MHVGRRNIRYEYEMYGTKLAAVEEEKDLGVWMHSSMKPTTQCERAAKSANMALGMILRAFHYRSREVLIPLYKTFVRPKMEYAAAVWSPWLKKDEDILEDVQKRMMRSLSDCPGRSYEERLEKAGLTTLKERRIRGDLIETFKVTKGIDRVDKNKWFDIRGGDEARPTRANTMISDGTVERRSDVLYKNAASSETRNNFFTMRVVRSWNELPEEVKSKKSVDSFKSAYDGWRKLQSQTIQQQ